jgi:hypothetical protein
VLRRRIMIFIVKGINIPIQIAANTSVDQWTQSTRLDNATKESYKIANDNANVRFVLHILPTQSAAAIANKETTRICLLGKLESQYHWVCQSCGRARSTAIVAKKTKLRD